MHLVKSTLNILVDAFKNNGVLKYVEIEFNYFNLLFISHNSWIFTLNMLDCFFNMTKSLNIFFRQLIKLVSSLTKNAVLKVLPKPVLLCLHWDIPELEKQYLPHSHYLVLEWQLSCNIVQYCTSINYLQDLGHHES